MFYVHNMCEKAQKGEERRIPQRCCAIGLMRFTTSARQPPLPPRRGLDRAAKPAVAHRDRPARSPCRTRTSRRAFRGMAKPYLLANQGQQELQHSTDANRWHRRASSRTERTHRRRPARQSCAQPCSSSLSSPKHHQQERAFTEAGSQRCGAGSSGHRSIAKTRARSAAGSLTPLAASG